MVIIILISQIIFTLYIYLSKKYNIIGKIIFQKEELIFKRKKNETRYKMEKIKEPKTCQQEIAEYLFNSCPFKNLSLSTCNV